MYASRARDGCGAIGGRGGDGAAEPRTPHRGGWGVSTRLVVHYNIHFTEFKWKSHHRSYFTSPFSLSPRVQHIGYWCGPLHFTYYNHTDRIVFCTLECSGSVLEGRQLGRAATAECIGISVYTHSASRLNAERQAGGHSEINVQRGKPTGVHRGQRGGLACIPRVPPGAARGLPPLLVRGASAAGEAGAAAGGVRPEGARGRTGARRAAGACAPAWGRPHTTTYYYL